MGQKQRQGVNKWENLPVNQKLCSSSFILDNRKWRTFYLKDDDGKLWVKVINLTKLTRLSRWLTQLTRRLFLIQDRDYTYWQILSLVVPSPEIPRDVAFISLSVPDPDLEIRGKGGGGVLPDPGITGEPDLQKINFGPPFGLKIRGGGGPPRPLPWIRHRYRE